MKPDREHEFAEEPSRQQVDLLPGHQPSDVVCDALLLIRGRVDYVVDESVETVIAND